MSAHDLYAATKRLAKSNDELSGVDIDYYVNGIADAWDYLKAVDTRADRGEFDAELSDRADLCRQWVDALSTAGLSSADAAAIADALRDRRIHVSGSGGVNGIASDLRRDVLDIMHAKAKMWSASHTRTW